MNLEHTCPICGKHYSVTVEAKDWKAYQQGVSVQKVFSYLPAIERDIAVGRFCTDCGYELYHIPKPDEDWGSKIGECQNCGAQLYEADIKEQGVCVCHSCKFPNELDENNHIVEFVFDSEDWALL